MNRFRRQFLTVVWLAVSNAWALGASIDSALPLFFNPGQSFVVTLSVAPGASVHVQAIEELPPAGWTVSLISHGGAIDPVSGKIKWGPFTDELSRSLTYTVTPPSGAIGQFTFTGSGAFDAALVTITGARSTSKFPGALVRAMASNYLPGQPLTNSLLATPAANIGAWAAEETVPSGWAVSEISEGGSLDLVNRKVKWGPYFDANARTLSFKIIPPTDSRTDVGFEASVRFDEALVTDAADLLLRPSILNRIVPATYTPLVPFEVELQSVAAPYVQILTIEESIEPGWTPANITGSGVWDAPNRKIKWGPLLGADIATTPFRYRLTPAAGASQPLSLAATAIFDSSAVTSTVTVARFLLHSENTVVRTIPANYRPGVAHSVSIAATPIDTALVYALEEDIPAGWTVSSISSGGAFDASSRKIKWGPFFDVTATPRTLTYQTTPPANAFGAVNVAGRGTFDAQTILAAGATSISHAPPTLARALPARYNPGQPFTVNMNAAPVPGVLTFAIEEQVPLGWTISAISEGGAYDAINKRVKWGPFLDHNLRTLTYTVTPPAGATGTNDFRGAGLFNRDEIPVTGAAKIRANRSPVAVADSVNRPVSSFFKLSVFTLLRNDTDADADALNIVSIDSTTEQGGSLQLIWPWIYYTPPPGLPVTDHFNYQVGDAFNATATGAVTLVPTPPAGSPAQNIVLLQPLPGGSARIVFSGVPGFTYHIQTSPDLSTWNAAADRVADSIGQFEFIDTQAASEPVRFYRTLWP